MGFPCAIHFLHQDLKMLESLSAFFLRLSGCGYTYFDITSLQAIESSYFAPSEGRAGLNSAKVILVCDWRKHGIPEPVSDIENQRFKTENIK